MKTVGVYEAKTHLPKLLEEVRRGGCITITRHGVPVAVLRPPEAIQRADPQEVITRIRKLREKLNLKGLSIKEMIAEGRR